MANVFRADHVGALIKPQSLLAAQEAFAAARIDEAALCAAQDTAIREALDLQKQVVMTVVTDGELRRANLEQIYVRAIEGIERHAPSADVVGARQSPYGVCAALAQRGRLTEHEVRFLKSSTTAAFKICLLSPSSLAVRLFKPHTTEAAYRDVQDLAGAFSQIIQSEIQALARDGVGYIQLNAPAYDALYDDPAQSLRELPGLGSAGAFEELLAIDAAMLESVKDSAAVLAMHVGRAEGADHAGDRYERMIARLLEVLPVDRMLLEYGEPSAHDFRALQTLPAGKMAVLGLVRTDGDPEEIGTLIGRIEEAARYTPEENLALSPRKGFSNNPYRTVAADLQAQRRTLIRTSEVVQQFWGLEL